MAHPLPPKDGKRDLVQDVRDLLRYEGKGGSIAPAVGRIAVTVAALQGELSDLHKQVAILTAWHKAFTGQGPGR
jgi:hypothetical protein